MYNILIADEDYAFHEQLAKIIGSETHNVTILHANSTGETIETMNRHKIDLLFLDIAMSNFTGIQIMDDIYKYEQVPDIIILSHLEHMEEARPFFAQGVIGFISKGSNSSTSSITDMELKSGIPILPTPNQENKVLMLSTSLGIYPTQVNSIIAVEKTERNILNVYTRDKVLKDVRGTLQQLERLCGKDFVYLNRQCMILHSAIIRVIPKTRQVFIKTSGGEVSFTCSRQKIRDLFFRFNTSRHILKLENA